MKRIQSETTPRPPTPAEIQSLPSKPDDVFSAIVEEIDVQGPDGSVTSVKVAHPGAKPTVLSESPSVARWKETFLIRAQDRPGVIVNIGTSEQRIREWLPDFGYTPQEIDAIVGVVRGQK